MMLKWNYSMVSVVEGDKYPPFQIPEIILENYHQLSLKFSDVYYQSKVLELLDYYRLGINEQIIFENR